MKNKKCLLITILILLLSIFLLSTVFAGDISGDTDDQGGGQAHDVTTWGIVSPCSGTRYKLHIFATDGAVEDVYFDNFAAWDDKIIAGTIKPYEWTGMSLDAYGYKPTIPKLYIERADVAEFYKKKIGENDTYTKLANGTYGYIMYVESLFKCTWQGYYSEYLKGKRIWRPKTYSTSMGAI